MFTFSRTPSKTTLKMLDVAATGLKAARAITHPMSSRIGDGFLASHYDVSLLNNEKYDNIVVLVEASLALLFQYRNATSKKSLLVSTCSFYHAVTGKSCVGTMLRVMDSLLEDLAEDLPFFQSGVSWIDVCDSLHKNVHRVIGSTLGTKLIKVFNHIIAHTLYAKMGVEVDHKLFSKIEEGVIRPTVWNCLTFVDGVVGLILFLCRAGRQALLTGSVECFFIDDTIVTTWIDEASTLRKEAEFISNPMAVGMTLPAYLARLDTAIKTGKQLVNHFRKGKEHTIIFNTLLELEMVHKRHQCSLVASSFRRAPVAVLIYGTAGIAKSFISEGLFNHYCSVRGIPKEQAVCWTRTENDDYYSGYKSHFAGVLYDDAAKFRPSVVQGVDPSIGDLIAACNNIQFITNQADLPDKGKIPFRSEWVGVTSNVADLNADMYFNSSAAFLRRFAVRITPTVKDEYKLPDQDRIDTSKIPPGVQYPDMWIFQVCLPVVNGTRGQFVEHAVFDYAGLLKFMTGVYQKHIEQQDRLMRTVADIGPEELCDCRLPVSICQCDKPGPMLADTVDVLVQSGLLLRTKPVGTKRIEALHALKRELKAKYHEPSDALMLSSLWTDQHMMQWLDPLYVDPDKTCDEAVADLTLYFNSAMEEFSKLTPRQKLDEITENGFKVQDDDLEYLTFEPQVGKPSFYIESQLSTLRKTVQKFAITLTKQESLLLDVYLYEHAPQHVASGWAMSDIIKGGLDYIKYYANQVEDPERVEMRKYLLDDVKAVGFLQRAGVWLAGQYFDRPWVFSITNWVLTVPGVIPCFAWMAAFSMRNNPREILERTARKYDAALGGNSPYIRSLLAVAGIATFVALICKYVVPQFFERTEPQMDLDTIGQKPVPREQEKKNVWTVKERCITKFDVDKRRPHNVDQCAASLQHNACYAEVRGLHGGIMATAKTRVLVIDPETIVVNNHALPPGSVIEIWCGPKTSEGVQPSVKISITEDMVIRYRLRDMAIIKTLGLPCRFKNIKHLLVKRTYQSVGPSCYFLKQKDGKLVNIECSGANIDTLIGMVGAPDVHTDCWSSYPERPTVSGECGAPLVVSSPLGSVIVALHCGYLAYSNKAWAFPIFAEDFDDTLYPEIGVAEPCAPVAQVGVFTNLTVNDKLYTDYHKSGHMMVHGQLRGFVPRPKFTGRKTPHASYVFGRGHEFTPNIIDDMDRPKNAGWKQPQMILENYLHPTHSMNETVMRACLAAFCDHIDAHLTDDDWADIHPVPINVAVNGFPGVPNVDSQKFTTSAGHGKRGAKLQFLTEPEKFEEWESLRRYSGDILNEVDEMRQRAYEGIRPHAIYDSCMKDEILSKKKVEAGRARAIYMCPVVFLTNMRMSVMGMCRVMIRRRDVFGIAVGLNTHSEEWDDVFKLAQEIEGDNWVASDFKAFEAVLNMLISNCTSKVFIHLAEKSGNFSSAELMALKVWLADISNAMVNFFGLLITLLGGEASGQQLTTFFNCIANNLLHMYSYVIIHRGDVHTYDNYKRIADEFFILVFRNTLGDDVYMKVHPTRPYYNHTNIQQVFESIGIEYTMADKDAESRPYIGWEEVTFLKRNSVLHEEFPGMVVAALSRKSIYKMLCYTVPSKTASQEEQLAAAMASAQAEAFFHGRAFFNQIHALILGLPKSDELVKRMDENPLPTWQKMVTRFIESSPKLQARLLVPGALPETTNPVHSYCHFNELELQAEWSVDVWGSTTMGRSPEDRIYERVRLSSKSVPKAGAIEKDPEPYKNFLSKNFNKNKQYTIVAIREMVPATVATTIKKYYNESRRKSKRDDWERRVITQADFVHDTVTIPGATESESVDVTQQNVVFKNEPTSDVVDLGSSSNVMASAMQMPQELGSYLQRPRLIFSYAWAENGANGLKTDFTPWRLFLADPSVENKLDGFSMFRGNLKLKFLVNGSPFYYGSLMAAYTPLSGWRADTAVSPTVGVTLVANSQKPHVWLENQNMSTAEMTLPFLFPYPYAELGVVQSLSDMGKISFIQYVPLLSANGTSSQAIDIQVYAWMDDLMLSGPTNQPIMQSKFVKDKQISGMATSVAVAAGKLKDAPIIGQYAMATSMAAGAIGKVADCFGFTNVPNTCDVAPYKQVPFQLASTEISEPIMKLSLQAKQETAIGAEQHGGSDKDELAISSIAGRSSFVVGSLWTTTAPPGETLFTTSVNPAFFDRSGTQIAHTPMSWLANHFQYWRGSLRFTFKVIRSPYHRGRLQVSWDRQATNLNQGGGLGNPNTYNTVMDLDEDSECSMVVPYMQPKQFLETHNVAGTGTTIWSVSATPSGDWSEKSNGILSLRVLNRLTAPEASSSATILVFVNAEPDFEFAGPKDYETYPSIADMTSLSNLTTSVVQSKVVYDDESEAHPLSSPSPCLHVYKEVFGERISSMREYLHRSSVSFVYQHPNATTRVGLMLNRIPIKRMPPPPGVYNNGWWAGTTTSGAGQRAFFTRFHPIIAMTSCFVGYKGSVNVTVNVDQPRDTPIVDTLAIHRTANGNDLVNFYRRPSSVTIYDTAESPALAAKQAVQEVNTGVSGTALTNTKTNCGLSAQLPYYSNSGFQLSNFYNEYSNQDTLTDNANDWWEIEWRYNKTAAATTSVGSMATVYYGTGPDFDLVFFVNVPVMTVTSVIAV